MCKYSAGLLQSDPEWENELHSFSTGAALALGRWDETEFLLNKSCHPTFESCLGSIFIAGRAGNYRKFDELMTKAYRGEASRIASIASFSYPRHYDQIVHLHILEEIRQGFQNNEMSVEKYQNIISTWNQRIDMVQDVGTVKEPILNVRRLVLEARM